MLTSPKLRDAMEVHAIAIKRLENAAKADIDRAYADLASRASLRAMGDVFTALSETAAAVIGKYGKRALAEARRYTREAFGIVGQPSATDLAGPIEEATAVAQEYARHTRALLEIRAARMQAAGMSASVIASVVQEDFRRGGRTFSPYRVGLKTAVAGAIQGLAQAQSMAALSPKDRSRADAA